MALKFTDVGYKQALFNFLKDVEGAETSVYLDVKGLSTIGIGFNIRDNLKLRNAVFTKFGLDWDKDNPILTLTDAQRATENDYIKKIKELLDTQYPANPSSAAKKEIGDKLNAIMAERYKNLSATNQTKTRDSFSFKDNTDNGEMRPIFDSIIPSFEKNVNDWLAGIPDSREKVALVSMAYGGSKPLGVSGSGALWKAIDSGNRAEAWFEIRFNSNGGDHKQAKRRYLESQMFGLYSGATLSDAEKDKENKNVFRMYNKHKGQIADYDKIYGLDGTTKDKNGNTPMQNAITEASLAGVGLMDRTIQEALQPARTYLLTEYVSGKGIATDIDGEILVGNDPLSDPLSSSQALIGQDALTGSFNNDLMLGEGGNDILSGGAGDDVIYGGKGNDILRGGGGSDTYVYTNGDGIDVIDDGNGLGSIVVAGMATLSGSSQTAYRINYQDSWDGAGGERYTLLDGNLKDGGTLKISGGLLGGTVDGAGEILVQHFKNGDLGITLNSEYDLAWLNDGEATPFTYGGAEPQPSSGGIGERGSRQFRVVLNRAARAGDKIVLKASGGQASHLAATFGDRTESFAGGTLELTLSEGQSEVAFAVAEVDNLDSPETYTLSATLQPLDADTAGASADYTLTVDGIDDTPAPITPTHTIDGGPGAETGKVPKPVSDSAASDQINCGPGNNTVTIVSGGGDIIDLGAGDDELYTAPGVTDGLIVHGGDGRDYVGAGNGRDIVEGGVGADGLYGSQENDRLYGESQGEAPDLIAAGATQEASGEQGEWVDAEDGDDQVFSGAANDEAWRMAA